MSDSAQYDRKNELPRGVPEAQLIEAVRSSGYPLQSIVARELSRRFDVIEEWGYADRTTGEHRALDIWAHAELLDGTCSGPRIYILAECKRSDLPFVFFPPGAHRPLWDFPEVVGLGGLGLSVSGGTRETSAGEFFRADELTFASAAPTVVGFTRAERKGSALELSGAMPFKQVVLPLASAMEQMKGMFAGAGLAMIVFPLCIVDAPMVIASGTPEAPVIAPTSWVRLVHQQTRATSHGSRRQNLTIDFLHRSFVSEYIDVHLTPFAESLAGRVQAYSARYGKSGRARPKDMSWDEFVGSQK